MYVPGLLGDLADILRTLTEAQTRIREKPTGPAWDGNLTNNLNPSAKEDILASLAWKIRKLDKWLRGDWTDEEAITLMGFVTEWRRAELILERFKNHYPEEPMADLASISLSGYPIPSLDIPARETS